MKKPLLADAFAHHVWSTLRLIDTCQSLTPEQLGSSVPGTYGSVLDTLRHLVGADCSYLAVISGGRRAQIEEDNMDLDQLRGAMETNSGAWEEVLVADLDPDAMLLRIRADGSGYRAPVGIRLAQVLHHGTDHRSQVCTALTALGVEPPAIDAWDFGAEHNLVEEFPAKPAE